MTIFLPPNTQPDRRITMNRKIRFNTQQLRGKGHSDEDLKQLFGRITGIAALLVSLLFIVIPLVTSMNIMRYLKSSDFIVACVSLAMLYLFYKMLFEQKRPKSGKPTVTYKQQPQRVQPQQPQYQPPQKLYIVECQMCGRSKLPQDVVEISDGVIVCKDCINKTMGNAHETHR